MLNNNVVTHWIHYPSGKIERCYLSAYSKDFRMHNKVNAFI